ncbi:MAG: SUMF1/EgtB/PvdO family nonheme iron enzyme [Treponema sp.]|nr:SUMF1/EgtB/PvdO family nonheme iron enzyme [Treponema sp.]
MGIKKPTVYPPAPEDQVRLKPFLGMRPGVYLAVIYSLVLLVVFFIVFLLPGITRPGAMVVFSSEPFGAALRVDSVYAGSSPCRVFVPKGVRVMDIVLPGFETQRVEHEIPGRLFASRFFPRRFPLDVTLETANPDAVLAMSVHEYAAWTFAGEPTTDWQIPLSLSEGVYRIGAAAATEETADIITASARFAVTRAALRDIVRAKNLSVNGGIPPSPLSLVQSVSDIAAFLSGNPASVFWLADTLPAESAAILTSSAWYQNELADSTAMDLLSGRPGEISVPGYLLPPIQQSLQLNRISFRMIDGGNFVQREPYLHLVPVESFFISDSVVPADVFQDFLDANPQWSYDRREALENQGLVCSEYLVDFDIRRNQGIVNSSSVSWYAAQAFCEWLSGSLPGTFSGWEVRLPAEAEWEYAINSMQQWSNRSTISVSTAWEWCSDPFFPLSFLSATREAADFVGSPERSVRGGGSLTGTGMSATFETRAGLSPQTCSPFITFRPVIARIPTGR